jgi:hypothetical protein
MDIIEYLWKRGKKTYRIRRKVYENPEKDQRN